MCSFGEILNVRALTARASIRNHMRMKKKERERDLGPVRLSGAVVYFAADDFVVVVVPTHFYCKIFFKAHRRSAHKLGTVSHDLFLMCKKVRKIKMKKVSTNLFSPIFRSYAFAYKRHFSADD